MARGRYTPLLRRARQRLTSVVQEDCRLVDGLGREVALEVCCTRALEVALQVRLPVPQDPARQLVPAEHLVGGRG